MLKFLFERNARFVQVFPVIFQFIFLYIISLETTKDVIYFFKKSINLDSYSLGL